LIRNVSGDQTVLFKSLLLYVKAVLVGSIWSFYFSTIPDKSK